MLGPWKIRSQYTKNQWVDAGFRPRVNDLVNLDSWNDSVLKRSALYGETDWNFQTIFHLGSDRFRHYNLHVGQSGIYQQIRLNGMAVNCNRYLPYGMGSFCGFMPSIPVSMLKDSGNVLRLNYYNPLDSERLAKQLTPLNHSIRDNDSSGALAIYRIPPVQGGWDVAPRRITVGLDEGVYLEGWNHFRIDNFTIQTLTANADSAVMQVSVDIETDTICRADLTVVTTKNGQFNGVFFIVANYHLGYGITQYQRKFVIHKPKLWWPNGMFQQQGEAKPELYELMVQVAMPGDTVFVKKNFGIRTIKLHQETDAKGKIFAFYVNEKPVFIKGANLVPTRGFLDEKKYLEIWQKGGMLHKLAQANLNMLRVWGGGGYEPDWFYDSCDANGIMVWQDFMYSGMMYAYKYDQQLEAEYQVKRLCTHPCMALWCGNNEIEVAWRNWGWQQKYNLHGKDSQYLWAQYQQIFHKMLPEMVAKYAPGSAYIPTSPQSNWGKPADFESGDNHDWRIWHGEAPMRSLQKPVPRFAGEWGFPSYPLTGFKDAGLDVPDSATQALLDRRLLSYKGPTLLYRYLDSFTALFPEEMYTSPYPQAFRAQTVFLSRGINAHRTDMPHCMGSLWWQLNDMWPGTTWSLIDVSGQPKPAFYALKDLYNPLAVFIDFKDEKNYTLLAVNDLFSDSLLTYKIISPRNKNQVVFMGQQLAKHSEVSRILSIPKSKMNAFLKDDNDTLSVQVFCNKRVVFTQRYGKNRM